MTGTGLNPGIHNNRSATNNPSHSTASNGTNVWTAPPIAQPQMVLVHGLITQTMVQPQMVQARICTNCLSHGMASNGTGI